MAILDEVSGFEFEELMVDVFRALGYENVRQAERTADLGRDILMEEVVDGTRRAVVVECKHTSTVGRPVVQKLHSAVATFAFDGPKRGMVVTSGRFTAPATEYAESLDQSGDPYPVALLDGQDLRAIADEIGLDLYNGRIEILCDDALLPIDPTEGVMSPVTEAVRDIENFPAARLPSPAPSVTFRPVVAVTAVTNAVFETSVGVIHRINDRTQFLIDAERGQPTLANQTVANLVTTNIDERVTLEDARAATTFEEVTERRFGATQTEYTDWAIERLRNYHTTVVQYTGDNNVTYTKTCEPTASDIVIHDTTPVYLPEVHYTIELHEYTYPYAYYAAGAHRVVNVDGLHRCVHCNTDGATATYTYCTNCGSINCPDHIKTERLEQDPVCTGCAATERFAWKTKYFYTEENLDVFRDEYGQMPFYEKLLENIPLTVAVITFTLLALLFLSISLL